MHCLYALSHIKFLDESHWLLFSQLNPSVSNAAYKKINLNRIIQTYINKSTYHNTSHSKMCSQDTHCIQSEHKLNSNLNPEAQLCIARHKLLFLRKISMKMTKNSSNCTDTLCYNIIRKSSSIQLWINTKRRQTFELSKCCLLNSNSYMPSIDTCLGIVQLHYKTNFETDCNQHLLHMSHCMFARYL